jgi:GTP-binding protein LepA
MAKAKNIPGSTPIERIRNFCIIAHIDHGKSTLADAMMSLTEVLPERLAKSQYLDRMDIEQERGITIKSQSIRMPWSIKNPETGATEEYTLNMIDTPGHVDFSYEVSRSLAATEGCILLIDASQGIEAQTLANLYQAIDQNLEIIPVLNKIDLPGAEPEKYAEEVGNLLGVSPDSVLRVSAKTKIGVAEVLNAIVEKVPHPEASGARESIGASVDSCLRRNDIIECRNDKIECRNDNKTRALIFDSIYDQFRGVITYIKVTDGELTSRDVIQMMSTGAKHELLELGVIAPEPVPTNKLGTGEVGYLITGVKDVSLSKVGDTVTIAKDPATEPLKGYIEPKPMVFSGLYPIDADDYAILRDALGKLKLNDAALQYTPETSVALGFGFRLGLLGLLHLEIVKERLEREFGLNLITTSPSVEYEVTDESGKVHMIHNPSEYPEGKVLEIKEPFVEGSIIIPKEYVGTVMELCQSRRGKNMKMEYLSSERTQLIYDLPLSEIVYDFFDDLKSRTKGYASLDYEYKDMEASDLVKVSILLQGEVVDAFSLIVHKDFARTYGLSITKKLKELIPRQQFEIPIQAAIGSQVIARENIRALRKDVLAKCYGGDITRKRKLLEKQKAGKKKMKTIGRVEVPPSAFISALSNS